MSMHAYLLFVAATIVLVLVPGPDMAYMLTRAVAQGRSAGSMAALGINLGAYVHLAAAIAGISALLLASATAYDPEMGGSGLSLLSRCPRSDEPQGDD